jgi:hypothetical protein
VSIVVIAVMGGKYLNARLIRQPEIQLWFLLSQGGQPARANIGSSQP